MLKHQGMELDTLLMQSNGLGFFDNLENSTYFCSIGTCILPEKFQNIDVPLNNKIQNPKLYPQELCRSSKEFLTYLSPNKRLEETKATECLFDPNIRKYGMTTSNMTGTDDFFMWPIELKSGLEKFNENYKTIYPDDSSNAAERRRKILASNGFNREYEEQENVQERKKMKKMILIPEECQRNEEAGGSKMPPWHAEVIEDMAADLDGSLSNLGADLAAGSYNMSEALLSLPSLTVFKQEAPSPSQETLINQQNLQQNVEDIQDPNSTLHRLLQQNNFQNHLKRSSSNKVPEINEKKNEDCRFQYVLAAATSIATKVTEETLTYLNQGQSYEIKLKKVGELSNFRGKILKSVIRICFHERRLQYMEKEQILAWQASRPGERIVELDVPLSYGLFDVEQDSNMLNTLSFLWDPTKEVGAYIKVNCISTEFTPKKHGGEKGVPFRIQVETFIDGESIRLHAAACQIKVFKLKGADRKHKQDREKILKRPLSEQDKYQPSYECTVLSDLLPDAIFPAPGSLTSPTSTAPLRPNVMYSNVEGSEPSFASQSHVRPPIASPGKVETNVLADCVNEKRRSPGPLPSCDASPNNPAIELTPESNSQQTAQWLRQNSFDNYVSAFANFSGTDILRLTRDDLIQICGLADGIRLLYALRSKAVITLYICTPSSPYYHAVYLDQIGRDEMSRKLAVLLGVHHNQIHNIFLQGPNDIRVLVTDEVVSHIKNESIFLIEVLKDEARGRFVLLMKPTPTPT